MPLEPLRFPGRGPLSQEEPIPGCPALHKEKRTLPGAPASFSGFVCVTSLRHSGFWDLNQTPFQSAGGNGGHCPSLLNGVRSSSFTHPLGPTDPCSTAGHMEPFSTSTFKALVCIFATTTKIFTRGGSTRTLGFHATALLLVEAYLCDIYFLAVDGRVWAQRYSAIHFQG